LQDGIGAQPVIGRWIVCGLFHPGIITLMMRKHAASLLGFT
jgi:hypothetical protein